MGSYKKIGLSHEMGLIDTPPLFTKDTHSRTVDRITTRGRTYVMITYVSNENNLGPDDKKKVYLGSERSEFYFVKCSWSALTSYIHIECYFMK